MTNRTREKLKYLYKQAKVDKGSEWAYSYYVGLIRRMGLTAKEYEQAVRRLAEVMGL